MKRFLIILIITILFTSYTSHAQQLGLYNLYTHNLYLINPAAAGLEDGFRGFVNHRAQWNGIDGSPSFSGVTLDGRFAKTHSVGTNLQFSDLGLLSQFSGKLTYAYHLQTGDNSYLHAGISLGMNNQSTNTKDIIATDYTDQLIYENPSEWGFVNDVGIMFTTDRLRLGIAVPQSFNVGNVVKTGRKENVNIYAAYDVISTTNWKMEGSVLYRNSTEQDDQLDIGGKVAWKDVIAIGAIYRSNFGLAAVTQLMLNDRFVLGYSYDFGGLNTVSGSGGSHGFMLGMKLRRKQRVSSPHTPPVSYTQDIAVDPASPAIEKLVEVKNEVQETQRPGQKEKNLVLLDSANTVFSHRDQLIRFEHASDVNVTSDNQMRVINDVVAILKSDPDLHVQIIGHASRVGNAEFNQRISERRAKLIADELIKKGIEPGRINQIGKGEEEPLSVIDASENRRVQVVFIYVE